MDQFGIARDKRMPPWQIAALRSEAISAGGRQPGNGLHGFGRKLHAVRYALSSAPVITTPTGTGLEEAAGHIRVVDQAGILVFQLD